MRWVKTGLLVLSLGWASAASAQSQSETLADIRQELSVLFVELQKLKRELSTTGGVSQSETVGGSVIERVAAIESELQRLIAKTEEIEFRVESVARDGTNRVEDLEFRICELEPACDIATLEPGQTLGGASATTAGQGGGTTTATLDQGTGTGAAGTADTGGTLEDGVQLAVGERADFDAAMAAFEAGEFASAADQFARFQTNYPGSPLDAQAGLKRGEALEQTDDMTGAARAYLDTFSNAPEGPSAPDALFLLGRSLGRLGQTSEACVTLGEVGLRFPGAPAVSQAASTMQTLGCS